jgi:cytochrome c
VSFVEPVMGAPFAFGTTVRYEVTVQDDQPFVCSRVSVDYVLGHDMHGHGISQAVGCSGSFEVPPLDESHLGAEVAGVFRASYTDNPGPGLPAVQSVGFVVLPPTPGFVPDAGAPDSGSPGGETPDAGAPDASAADASAP